MPIVQASTLSSHPTGTARARAMIPLCAPALQGNEWKYLKDCVDTGWVSSVGPFVDRLEREVASYVHGTHAVAVVNGTAALHTALRVIGVQPEDEVLVSDLTFIAPVNAIHYCGAHPIFVDADPSTWQMDAEQVERFLADDCAVRGGQCYNRRSGRRVSAMVPVHILGLACAMDRLTAVAHAYHLRVVEDAAEGMGVRYQGRHVGTFGDVGCFSFNGNKIMTSGGGGLLVTERSDWAASARYLTTQARDDELEYVHKMVGYNYRLTNLQAALGVAQLEQLDTFIEKKRALARAYAEALRDVPGLTLMPSPPGTEPTYWLYTVLLPPMTTAVQRQALLRRLHAAGIGARPLWSPIHTLPPYRKHQRLRIRHATQLYARGISLPCSVGLTPDEFEHCVATFKQSLRDADIVR